MGSTSGRPTNRTETNRISAGQRTIALGHESTASVLAGAQDCTLSSVVSRISRYPLNPIVPTLTRVHDFLSMVQRVLRIETRCSIGGPGGQSASGRQLRIARRPSGRRMRRPSSSAASRCSISCQMSANTTRSQDAVARCVSAGTPHNKIDVVRSERAGQAGAKLITQGLHSTANTLPTGPTRDQLERYKTLSRRRSRRLSPRGRTSSSAITKRLPKDLGPPRSVLQCSRWCLLRRSGPAAARLTKARGYHHRSR